MILTAKGEQQQERLGGLLAQVVPQGFVIYLNGELGTGKTTLVRGFLRGLGYQGAVKSPTYTLLEPYELPDRHCYHLDLYRLVDPEELEYLGLRELDRTDAITLVEWPKMGEGALPMADLQIDISYEGEGRLIQLRPLSKVAETALSHLLDHFPLEAAQE